MAAMKDLCCTKTFFSLRHVENLFLTTFISVDLLCVRFDRNLLNQMVSFKTVVMLLVVGAKVQLHGFLKKSSSWDEQLAKWF